VRHFLSGCLSVILGVIVLAASVGLLIWHEQTIQVVRVQVSLAELPAAWDGVRIGLISDLHIGSYMDEKGVAEVVRRLNAQNVEFIVIAGDTVDIEVKEPERAAPAIRALGDLRTPLGTYLVFGNHDYPRAALWRPLFKENGIQVLEDEHVRFTLEGESLYLVGLTDAFNGRPDPAKAWRGIPAGAAVIAAVHEPDVADWLVERPPAMQLSGHSHGGQIRIPFRPPLLLPPLGRRYPLGLQQAAETGHFVYTTRGVGKSDIPLRFLARPEITVITLRREKH
jgi:predicted MPP superfamily phosphohydrolase